MEATKSEAESEKFRGTVQEQARQITVGPWRRLANKTTSLLGSPIKSTTVYNESPKRRAPPLDAK